MHGSRQPRRGSTFTTARALTSPDRPSIPPGCVSPAEAVRSTKRQHGPALARDAPCESRDLRQAFEFALDRSLINHVVFGGSHRPNCFPFPEQSAYFAATKGLPCHLKANVAAAKAAFNRSGASAPVDVHLMLGTTTVAARLGALIAGMEKPIGFNVILEPTEFATGLSRAAAGRFDMFQLGWSGRVDPDANLQQFVNAKGSSNYSGYVNAAVDRATVSCALHPELGAANRAVPHGARAAAEGRAADLPVQPDQPLRRLEDGRKSADLRRRSHARRVRRLQQVGILKR